MFELDRHFNTDGAEWDTQVQTATPNTNATGSHTKYKQVLPSPMFEHRTLQIKTQLQSSNLILKLTSVETSQTSRSHRMRLHAANQNRPLCQIAACRNEYFEQQLVDQTETWCCYDWLMGRNGNYCDLHCPRQVRQGIFYWPIANATEVSNMLCKT